MQTCNGLPVLVVLTDDAGGNGCSSRPRRLTRPRPDAKRRRAAHPVGLLARIFPPFAQPLPEFLENEGDARSPKKHRPPEDLAREDLVGETGRIARRDAARGSEGGMIRLETLIELKCLNSTFLRAYDLIELIEPNISQSTVSSPPLICARSPGGASNRLRGGGIIHYIILMYIMLYIILYCIIYYMSLYIVYHNGRLGGTTCLTVLG